MYSVKLFSINRTLTFAAIPEAQLGVFPRFFLSPQFRTFLRLMQRLAKCICIIPF